MRLNINLHTRLVSYLPVIVLASYEQRRERPVILRLDSRPRCAKLPHRVQVPPLCRKQERSERSVASSLDVGAPFEKLVNEGGVGGIRMGTGREGGSGGESLHIRA